MQVKGILGSEKVLFWLEVLSLLNAWGSVGLGLHSTSRWLQCQKDFENVMALARDCLKFVQTFVSAVSHSTPHLYISAVPILPANSAVAQVLQGKFSGMVEVAVGHLTDWPNADLLLLGHALGVRSVAFSLDGTRIVSGSDDQTVRVWDAERGVQIGSPLQGHVSWVTSVAFSPDGTKITVRMWDAERGVQINREL
ncbi:hypothetical protein ID866_6432 [Astraeus odoratus]|nr:hypothetical protein ID866_6432 [Astraeus odoratus]